MIYFFYFYYVDYFYTNKQSGVKYSVTEKDQEESTCTCSRSLSFLFISFVSWTSFLSLSISGLPWLSSFCPSFFCSSCNSISLWLCNSKAPWSKTTVASHLGQLTLQLRDLSLQLLLSCLPSLFTLSDSSVHLYPELCSELILTLCPAGCSTNNGRQH